MLTEHWVKMNSVHTCKKYRKDQVKNSLRMYLLITGKYQDQSETCLLYQTSPLHIKLDIFFTTIG